MTSNTYVFSFEVHNDRYLFEFTQKGWRINGLEYNKNTDNLFSKYNFPQTLNDEIRTKFLSFWDKLYAGESEATVAQLALDLENEIKK